MMDSTEFDEALRRMVRREPFLPFEVELESGEVIRIPDRPVVFCEGAATYITPNYHMIEFYCEQVVAIRDAPDEIDDD